MTSRNQGSDNRLRSQKVIKIYRVETGVKFAVADWNIMCIVFPYVDESHHRPIIFSPRSIALV